MKKNILEFLASAGVACCLLGVSLPAYAATLPYVDVPADAWYYQAVQDVTGDNVLLGAAGNRFNPGAAVSREDFNLALWMLATGSQEQNREAAATWAGESGVFSPDTDLTQALSRAEAALSLQAFLQNLAVAMPATLNIPPAFADQEQIGEAAALAVQTMQTTKLMQGFPDGTFRPAAGLTRAEAAAILQKLAPYCQNLPLILTLPGNATTGYAWQVGNYDQTLVQVEELPYVDLGNGETAGGPGVFRFAVYGLKEGRVVLDFYYGRSWEPGQEPADEAHYTLAVDGEGQVTQISR